MLKQEMASEKLECDVCCQYIKAGSLAFSCQPCDHDMCLTCGDKLLKEAQCPATKTFASPLPMEGLIITPTLRAHVEMAAFNASKQRAKQGLNKRKDFKLDPQLVYDHVKEQVRPFTPPSLSLLAI